MASVLTGRATEEGTRRYAARVKAAVPAEHYRVCEPLGLLSSLGFGTYLGQDDAATDALYRRAGARALELGFNVIDTAVNYRHQRSERAVGAELEELVGRQALRRDEVVVASKGGYIPLDAEATIDARAYVLETYLKTGLIRPEEVAGGTHCMSPRYLRDQIERSRRNLGLETIDIYYLHNPETQLAEVERPVFLARIRAAFGVLEEAVGAAAIACYGTATWDGFRQLPSARDYLSLEELIQVARDVGGADHHFKVIQLPYNLAMTEAFTRANQRVGGDTVTALEAARRLGLYVVASASVYQGALTRDLPPVVADYLPGLRTDAQRALQFVRSTPGVGTALVGMKTLAHVEENAAVAVVPPMVWEQFKRMFSEA
jgi:aryl-alcohol dehydrogenase-like predicted oxidoreductase